MIASRRRLVAALGPSFALLVALVVFVVARRLKASAHQTGTPTCEAWTLLENGVCKARPWVLASRDEGIEGTRMQLRGLAIDGRGRGVAAWNADSSTGATVEVGEELAPGRWTKRAPAAALGGQSQAIALAVGADGAALVAWIHAPPLAGVFTSTRNAAGEWLDPSAAEPSAFSSRAVEPAVAIGPHGEQLVTWCQGTRTGWGIAIAHRTDAGAPWERPASPEDVVSPDILFANQPQLAVDAKGDAVVAWYQSEGVPLMTYVSERHGPAGAFARAGVHDHLSALGAPVDSDPLANAKPALGPRGEAAVVWVQENAAGATPVYLATREPAGEWTKPRDLADSFSKPGGVARTAQVAFGARGDLYVVWALKNGAKATILAARRDAHGVWVQPGRDPARLSSADTAYEPVLATGPDGGVIAAWMESAGVNDERVAARRTAPERPRWEALEWLSPRASGHLSSLRVAMGPHDRTLVGWVSTREGRILFARID